MDWKHPKNRWQPEAVTTAPSHSRWGHFSSWAPGEAAIADDASIVVVARSSGRSRSDDLHCLTTNDGADQMESTVAICLPSTAKFCSRPVLTPLPFRGQISRSRS